MLQRPESGADLAQPAQPKLALPEIADGPALSRRMLAGGGFAVVAAAALLRWRGQAVADDVAPEEVARRRAALPGELPLRLRPIRPADLPAALRGLGLPAAQLAELENAIAARLLRMAWLEVFDSDAVDGDRVTINSLGLSQTVELLAEPVRVPIFLPADNRVQIVGADEGLGGGITLGVVSNGQRIKLPPLTKGQTVSLAVAAMAP